MSNTNYRIEQSTFGLPKIRFACPACKTMLKAKITEGGDRTNCPACGDAFDVPGLEEKERYLEKQRLQAEVQKVAEAEAMKREAEQAEQREKAKQQRDAELVERRQAAKEMKLISQAQDERLERLRKTPPPILIPERNYPALIFYSSMLFAVGVVIALVSALAAIINLFYSANYNEPIYALYAATVLLLGAIACLPFFMLSEAVKLAVDVEENTRIAANNTVVKK